jgi:hypothetical protein
MEFAERPNLDHSTFNRVFLYHSLDARTGLF